MQERTGLPSMWTVQAPHCAMLQPNFVPVKPSKSRSTHSSGMSSGASSVWTLPLIISRIGWDISLSAPCHYCEEPRSTYGSRRLCVAHEWHQCRSGIVTLLYGWVAAAVRIDLALPQLVQILAPASGTRAFTTRRLPRSTPLASQSASRAFRERRHQRTVDVDPPSSLQTAKAHSAPFRQRLPARTIFPAIESAIISISTLFGCRRMREPEWPPRCYPLPREPTTQSIAGGLPS